MPDSSALRVAMVTPRFLPESGGVERHVDLVASRLARLGVDVTVITTDRSGTLPPLEERNGVTVRRVRAHPRRRDWLWAPGIGRAIAAAEPDVVHVQSYHTFVAPLAMAASLRRRIPYVVTFHAGGHSSRLRTAIRSPQLRLLRPFLRRADRLVALARFEIEAYGRALGVDADRFALVPNGSDLTAAAVPPGPRDPLVVSMGRLERYKGHHRVLAAFAHVARDRPAARLLIAGGGPYEGELRRQVDELGLADRVLIESVPIDRPEELAARLARAKLLVLLSDFETHPISAPAGAALGCRLLVRTTSGLAELVESGLAAGVAPEAGAPEVAAAILEQLDAPPAAHRIRLPTWDDCAAGLLQVYLDARGAAR
jgi:glycosyltransferase involved in cell wall biosynthesis